MKRKINKDRPHYALGGATDPVVGIPGQKPTGKVKQDNSSLANDVYLRDLLTATTEYGKGWEGTPAGQALIKQANPDILSSVSIFNNNPQLNTIPAKERPTRYFENIGTNPVVEETRTRLRGIGTGIRGNQNSTVVKDIQDNGVAKFAAGGVSTASGGSPWGGLISQIPGVADNIISLFENNPNAYSRQPIVNATSMRDMVSPYTNGKYAMGGESGMDDETMNQLQAMADEQGISVEELIQMLQDQQGQQDEGSNDTGEVDMSEGEPDSPETFAMGGWIKKAVNPAHKGYCTPMTKATCTPRRKALARTFKKHHGFHAMGGIINNNNGIEVEGKETIQTPDGDVTKMRGPSHEDGGIDLSVPDGTKIYSDRLKIDGQTMSERKLKRERATARLEKLKLKNPTDKLLQNTLERSYNNYAKEEKSDMDLQKAMAAIYAPSHDNDNNKMAYGGNVPGWEDVYNQYNNTPPSRLNYAGITPDTSFINMSGRTPGIVGNNPAVTPNKVTNPSNPGQLGAGDYVGMAGNLFNAIAPIINTKNAAAATKPVINRFIGFGKNALDTNQNMQTILGTLGANQQTDISTASNTSKERNRNSTSSVNTLRALDATTDMNTTKARQGANDSMSRSLMTLLGQRSQLQNVQDNAVMRGEERRDIEQKANTDNYYSNMAQNLTNFGTNVQGIGRNLNVARSNKTNANLISQMSKYGLGFDADGNLISKQH